MESACKETAGKGEKCRKLRRRGLHITVNSCNVGQCVDEMANVSMYPCNTGYKSEHNGQYNIVIVYYTDVHARPEASSDMSVFTITARWLLLANFNRRTAANAVHSD